MALPDRARPRGHPSNTTTLHHNIVVASLLLRASVLPTLGRGWRGFGAVDTRGNRNLIATACREGVPAFVYVSVFHHDGMRRLAYVDAHERVVDELRASPLAWAVLRPTGFHSALDTYVDMARSGTIPEIGDGRARTNPVSDAVLATLCADAITDPARRSPAQRELAVGGGEILSRREIGELAFAAIGAAPRFRHIRRGSRAWAPRRCGRCTRGSASSWLSWPTSRPTS